MHWFHNTTIEGPSTLPKSPFYHLLKSTTRKNKERIPNILQPVLCKNLRDAIRGLRLSGKHTTPFQHERRKMWQNSDTRNPEVKQGPKTQRKEGLTSAYTAHVTIAASLWLKRHLAFHASLSGPEPFPLPSSLSMNLRDQKKVTIPGQRQNSFFCFERHLAVHTGSLGPIPSRSFCAFQWICGVRK